MLEPVGFWSYARQDDSHSDGQLSQLRAIVGKALSLQFGAEIQVWQDIAAIPYGSDWAATIERTINQTTFFIPILTPRFLKSEQCHAEFTSFRQRMLALGRDDLIFPVQYVGVDTIRAQDCAFGDDLLVLRRHQWINFVPLFYRDPRSPEVRQWAGELATSILRALAVTAARERPAPASTFRNATGPNADQRHEGEARAEVPSAASADRLRAAGPDPLAGNADDAPSAKRVEPERQSFAGLDDIQPGEADLWEKGTLGAGIALLVLGVCFIAVAVLRAANGSPIGFPQFLVLCVISAILCGVGLFKRFSRKDRPRSEIRWTFLISVVLIAVAPIFVASGLFGAIHDVVAVPVFALTMALTAFGTGLFLASIAERIRASVNRGRTKPAPVTPASDPTRAG